MGEIKRDIKRPGEVGLHISQAKRGKPFTEEHKRKLSEAPRKPPTHDAIAKRTNALRKHYQDPVIFAHLKRNQKNYTCAQCGKAFHGHSGRSKEGDNKYCSVECRGLSKRTSIIKTCEQCGVTFKTCPSKLVVGEGKYCSKRCAADAKRDRITTKCHLCGKEISVVRARIAGGHGKYCSKKCSNVAHSGPNCPLYVHGKWKTPYCPKFNEKLKEEIRNSFGRRCFLCGASENGKRLSVHHVDFNKGQGCGQRWSLIPLCVPCHTKTNHYRHYYFNLLSNYWIYTAGGADIGICTISMG
jgi:hypothetical protein